MTELFKLEEKNVEMNLKLSKEKKYIDPYAVTIDSGKSTFFNPMRVYRNIPELSQFFTEELEKGNEEPSVREFYLWCLKQDKEFTNRLRNIADEIFIQIQKREEEKE